VRRAPQRPVADAELHALEVVPRLDQAIVGHDLEPEPLRHRARGFLGPLERGAEQGHDGPAGEIVRRSRGHRATVRGQVIARQAAVDDAARVFHLAVPEQVDGG
jgi:hypothetical protein